MTFKIQALKFFWFFLWFLIVSFSDQGLVKAIGVSNFEPAHLDDLLQHCTVVPALNQCEFHPDFCPQSVLDACKKHGVLFQVILNLWLLFITQFY